MSCADTNFSNARNAWILLATYGTVAGQRSKVGKGAAAVGQVHDLSHVQTIPSPCCFTEQNHGRSPISNRLPAGFVRVSSLVFLILLIMPYEEMPFHMRSERSIP